MKRLFGLIYLLMIELVMVIICIVKYLSDSKSHHSFHVIDRFRHAE